MDDHVLLGRQVAGQRTEEGRGNDCRWRWLFPVQGFLLHVQSITVTRSRANRRIADARPPGRAFLHDGRRRGRGLSGPRRKPDLAASSVEGVVQRGGLDLRRDRDIGVNPQSHRELADGLVPVVEAGHVDSGQVHMRLRRDLVFAQLRVAENSDGSPEGFARGLVLARP